MGAGLCNVADENHQVVWVGKVVRPSKISKCLQVRFPGPRRHIETALKVRQRVLCKRPGINDDPGIDAQQLIHGEQRQPDPTAVLDALELPPPLTQVLILSEGLEVCLVVTDHQVLLEERARRVLREEKCVFDKFGDVDPVAKLPNSLQCLRKVHCNQCTLILLQDSQSCIKQELNT